MTQEIFVVGFPRSGNTWLSQLLADALNSPFRGWRDTQPIGCEGKDRSGDCVIYQLHLLPRYERECKVSIPDGLTYYPPARGNEKLVHVIRDPRDVAVSVKFWWGRPSMLEGIDATGYKESSMIGTASWAEYVSAWLKVPDVVHVKYEDLQANTIGELARVLNNLGLTPVNDLEKVIERQEFNAKQKQIASEPGSARNYGKEIQQKHLRKGIVGDWRNYFGPEERKRAHDCFWPLMHELGYEDNEDWWG